MNGFGAKLMQKWLVVFKERKEGEKIAEKRFYRLQIANYRLQIADGLNDCGADPALPVSSFQFPVPVPVSSFQFPVSSFQFPVFRFQM